VQRVLTELSDEYSASGRSAWYELFEARVFPAGNQRVSQQSIAVEYLMTADQVRYRVKLVTERFDQLLRQEVRQQVGAATEIQQEIQDLLSLVGDRQ
jgi:hypothetical protein